MPAKEPSGCDSLRLNATSGRPLTRDMSGRLMNSPTESLSLWAWKWSRSDKILFRRIEVSGIELDLSGFVEDEDRCWIAVGRGMIEQHKLAHLRTEAVEVRQLQVVRHRLERQFRVSTLRAISNRSELTRLVATSVARASLARRASSRTHAHTAEKLIASKRNETVIQRCDGAEAELARLGGPARPEQLSHWDRRIRHGRGKSSQPFRFHRVCSGAKQTGLSSIGIRRM